MLKGIAASDGIGIGKAVIFADADISFESHPVTDVTAEIQKYKAAIDKFSDRTEKQAETLRQNTGDKEADILLGHILMIKDPYLDNEIETLIRNGVCVESALVKVCENFIDMFSATEDDLIKQRVTDIKDIRDAVLRILLGAEEINLANLPQDSVLVADELTPSVTAGIDKKKVVGIVTRQGGLTSHSAILARALGIPAVLGVHDILEKCVTGKEIIVNGQTGDVILDVTPEQLCEYKNKQQEYIRLNEYNQLYLNKQTVMKDGKSVQLFCNIGNATDIQQVIENSGEGIGLFRTEFLFMNTQRQPSEEEQFEVYKKVAVAMNGKVVTIRTLDVGGDKDIPYLKLDKEANPFLGLRAIRYCLNNIPLYKTQLRAILRASNYGNIRIMIPLVTCIEEVRAVKELIETVKLELSHENIRFKSDIKIGVMIETASAAVIADILAKECDFFSIGTNDLIQYTMSVDRGNDKIAYLYSPYQPSVLRLIKNIIEQGKNAGIEVGMCGETAANPLLIPIFLSFGLDEFSVTPSSVLQTRRIISYWGKIDADDLSTHVLKIDSAEKVQKICKKYERAAE